MILVVGATGHLGVEVCERLSKRGKAVRALARQTSNPEILDRLDEKELDDIPPLCGDCPGRSAPASSQGDRSSRSWDKRSPDWDESADCPAGSGRATSNTIFQSPSSTRFQIRAYEPVAFAGAPIE